MPGYAITANFLRESISNPKPYFTDVLMQFASTLNPLKVVVDSGGKVLETYRDIGENSDLITTWIDIMSHNPSNFEAIPELSLVEVRKETEIFIELAKNILGDKNLVLKSRYECKGYNISKNIIMLECGNNICIYDKDEIVVKLRQVLTQIHSGGGDNIAGNKIVHKGKG